MRRAVCLLVVLLLAAATSNAAEYYASPTGSATGSGAIGSPWNLQTALNKGYPANTVHAGDIYEQACQAATGGRVGSETSSG